MRRLLPGILAVVLLGGCASVDSPGGEAMDTVEVEVEQGGQPEGLSPAPLEPPKPYEYPARNFEKDTLYRLLVAETAGYRGQYEKALQEYLAVAEETRDPGVAARATRLAAYLKQDEKALDAALIWAAEEPDSIDAHRHAADKLMKTGDLEGAVRHMEAVKRLGGLANFEVFAYRAANLDRRDRDALLQAISKMLETYPGDRQLMYAKAVLLEQNGEYEQAVEFTDRLLAKEKDVNTVILKVLALTALDRTDDALEFLAASVESLPDERRLRLTYARHLFEAERLADARDQYKAILEEDPNDGDILFALALIAMEQEQDAEAKEYLNQMVRWNQRPGEAHFYLGSIAEKNEDIPRAIREYKQAGQGYEFLPAQARIVELMIDQGRLEEARQYLANLRGNHPERYQELVQLEAQVLAERGFEKEAFALLDKAVASEPDNIELRYLRAMTAEKFDRLDLVESDLRHVLEIDPDNADALNALGYTLTDRTDRHEEALALIRKALEIKPDEAAYIDSLGWVQYRLRNFEEAVTHLRRALRLFPNDEVAAHLGEVLWVMGEKMEANEVWEEALERTPDSEVLKRVINRLRGQ
ncbi:MAG: tetratricopeptide repeat protein [Pseudomonadales bacterium]|nr:tetratricopeptide repeat protein [Pseudomonadales bacterium]